MERPAGDLASAAFRENRGFGETQDGQAVERYGL
jgi:hypothetical protein